MYGSYITASEARNIWDNHVNSFLLEEYLRWFTGTDMSEFSWKTYTNLTSKQPILDESYNNLKLSSKPGGKFIFTEKSLIDTQEKDKTISPDDSLKSYLKNETFALSSDSIERMYVYPRKFDRVFTLGIDPDNFTVDTVQTSPSTLESLASLGIILKDSRTNQYTHRNSNENDICFNEYFVTVEPLDFKREKR